MPFPNVVAILNSNDDVVEMLRIALEQEGFVTVSGHVDKIRRAQHSLTDLVEEHDPGVLIYDLVPPYDRNWRYLEHLRSAPNLRGRHFIITSTNAAAARQLGAANAEVFEILGKPYDIEAIVDAVSRAASAIRKA
jgi:DNA-binding NarL/FixJ family response regulator